MVGRGALQLKPLIFSVHYFRSLLGRDPGGKGEEKGRGGGVGVGKVGKGGEEYVREQGRR